MLPFNDIDAICVNLTLYTDTDVLSALLDSTELDKSPVFITWGGGVKGGEVNDKQTAVSPKTQRATVWKDLNK